MKKRQVDILNRLREDARQSIAAVARSVGAPGGTVADEVKRLESYAISKYVPLLDWKQCNLEKKMVFLKIEKVEYHALLAALSRMRMVNSVVELDGQHNIMVELFIASTGEYYKFLKVLDQFAVVMKEVFNVVDELKAEEFRMANE